MTLPHCDPDVRLLETINKWYGNTLKTQEDIAELKQRWDDLAKGVRPIMHTFDYVSHRVEGDKTGVVCVCANCFEVRFLYGPDREQDYHILNHSELVPCAGGAVYTNRGRPL